MEKTQRALTQALKQLLLEKPLYDITISDLCETAMVRRATFYRHFRDKDDFLMFCIEQQRACFNTDCMAMHGDTDLEYCMEVLRGILRYLRENRALLDPLLRHDESAAMAQMFTRKLMHAMQAQVPPKNRESGRDDGIPPEVVAAFFSGALLGIAKWWIASDADMDEETLLNHTKALLKACMPTATQQKEGTHER